MASPSTCRAIRMAEDRVVAILASSGGRWSGIEADGRHPKIVILDARDRQHRIAFNAHPRDHQSECDNIVSRTRRLVADPRYARAKFPDGSHVLVRGGQLELQLPGLGAPPRPPAQSGHREIAVSMEGSVLPIDSHDPPLLPLDDSPSSDVQWPESPAEAAWTPAHIERIPAMAEEAQTPAAEPKNHLTFTEKLTVHTRLGQVLKIVGERVVEYSDSHTDLTVAEEMTFRCTRWNVQSIRQEVFGELRPATAAGRRRPPRPTGAPPGGSLPAPGHHARGAPRMTRRLFSVTDPVPSKPIQAIVVQGTHVILPLDEVPPGSTPERTLILAIVDLITKLPVGEMDGLSSELVALLATEGLNEHGRANIDFFRVSIDHLRQIHDESRMTLARQQS